LRSVTAKSYNKLVRALLDVYGDVPITFKQIKAVHSQNPENYPFLTNFVQNTDFRVSRNVYRVKLLDEIQNKPEYTNDAQALIKYLFNS